MILVLLVMLMIMIIEQSWLSRSNKMDHPVSIIVYLYYIDTNDSYY